MQPSHGHLDVGNLFASATTDHAADAEIVVLARMTLLSCSLDNCSKSAGAAPFRNPAGAQEDAAQPLGRESQKSLDGVTQDAIITAAC